MKALVAPALALVALMLCVPVAGAEPDSYQPQLKTLDAQAQGASSDVVDRAIANRTRSIPQDAFDRAPLADRPVSTPTVSAPAGTTDGLRGLALVGALGLAVAVGATGAAALIPVGRRTLAHR